MLCAMVGAGCGAPMRWSNGEASPEALAAAVLRGFERRDLAALRALAVTEDEFREHVWPALPAARPERNLPFSYVWGDLRQKSEQRLRQLVASHGGKRLTLVRVEHAGPTTEYGRTRVHRDTRLVVREPGGRQRTVRLYGSTVQSAGAFKVFSYIADD